MLIARDRFLKKGGLVLPTTGDIYLAPFTDQALYDEQAAKAVFWETEGRSFYGLDLSSAAEKAKTQHFGQPIVGYFDSSILVHDTEYPCVL